MKILITGNMGYLGPVLTQHLRNRHEDLVLIGFDNGFFGHCLTHTAYLPELRMDEQVIGDLRHFPVSLLKDVDMVIHLAAISNDPMGNRFQEATWEINAAASANLAQAAKKSGVQRFIFASSCSLYGSATEAPRQENDPLQPLSAYARSKSYLEQELENCCDANFSALCLRFATACGLSDRLRLDLVFNDFVNSAVSQGIIQVLSDGTPWRPLIHVQDMARAIDWALQAVLPEENHCLVLNIGSPTWTFQMADLAHAIAKIIPKTQVRINPQAQPDRRSYQVDFSLFQSLAPAFQPRVSLETAVEELASALRTLTRLGSPLNISQCIRLQVLKEHIQHGLLDSKLFWTRQGPAGSMHFNPSTQWSLGESFWICPR